MIRIHASYHKCLTMYFLRTMNAALNKSSPFSKDKYTHFESMQSQFYNHASDYTVCSINGFTPCLESLGEDFRITRFVRDPRDLMVSGYFYHKKRAEPWFRFKHPTDEYFSAINGKAPEGIPKGISYADYLNTLDVEKGLLTEMEFRQYHFESMLSWPDDERIRVFRYEDIVDDQLKCFEDILDHLEIHGLTRRKIMFFANRNSLGKRKNDAHVRNPSSGQWREHFTDRVHDLFLDKYRGLLERYEYPLE